MKKKAIDFQVPAAGWFRLDAFGFISRNSMAMISGLQPLFPLLVPSAPPFPRCAGAQQPVLYLELLMNTKARGALFCHRLRGKSREAGKGEALFRRP